MPLLAVHAHDAQTAEWFDDPARFAAATCHETLHGQCLANAGLGNDKAVDVKVVVVFGVGDGGCQNLAHVFCHSLLENFRMLSASSAFLPRISAATRPSF
jgi:hypothetical protein